MNLKRYATPALAAAIATATLAWHGYHPGDPAALNAPLVAEAQASPLGATPPPASVGLPDFTDLVQRASPAVVNISATRTVPAANRGPFGGVIPFDRDSPYFEFFKRFGPPLPEGGDGPIARSGGSGFIVSPDGHVLTNAHVVAGADEVTVQLADKREFRAKVIGVDETTDVALIKIDAHDLPTLKVGDPAHLKVGEWVIAIGSPFGFDHTVSAGVVSAKMRTLPNGGYVPFIQTDVAINPGNSGGPLLNLAGEVVGINSQIYSQSGGYMGLSFAIPIDLAMNVQQQLAQNGKVTRGRLGVGVQSLNQDLAQSFGLDSPHGALVSQVEDGTPAARAGLRTGDVILGFDGERVEDSAMLSRLVAAKKPGDRVEVEFLRDGKRQHLDVALGAVPSDGLASADTGARGEAGRLGVVVQELPPEQREQGAGVVVAAVSGAAAKAGIREGDVILAVGSERVASAAKLKELVARAPGHIALLVQRDDAQIYVPVNLG
ncbi:MAG TPA: DegQ family serine endoprotease [Gammaproteobacteria bacterium]|nr:DegQ family serine endoprotease [Gammaproteobacteria bacterium]